MRPQWQSWGPGRGLARSLPQPPEHLSLVARLGEAAQAPTPITSSTARTKLRALLQCSSTAAVLPMGEGVFT